MQNLHSIQHFQVERISRNMYRHIFRNIALDYEKLHCFEKNVLELLCHKKMGTNNGKWSSVSIPLQFHEFFMYHKTQMRAKIVLRETAMLQFGKTISARVL